MNQENDRSAMLSVAAVAAMVTSYLLAFTVLSDTDIASKFENGVVPPGTDVTGLRTAAVSSIVAAAGAWVAAVASRKAVPIVLVLISVVPFSPLALFALGLAF
jgi:hypothetical protein